MVRSLWLRALATTLVWTGVAWAQQPGSAPSDKSGEQILTIQEAGKSPQQCRVLKTFRTTDGHLAYQVRALDTGEMMTITEKATSTSTYGAKPQSVATQIYHWGRNQVSPPGVPAPVGEKPVAAAKSSGASAPPYSPASAEAAKAAVNSPYSSTYRAPVPAASSTAVTQPVPEKDWRQSWVRSEEKPIRIDDKLKTRDNIAEVPPLRIEGKPVRQEEKSVAKQAIGATKGGLNLDDPLMNPDKYMPKSLDVTPRAKPPEAAATRTPGSAEPAPNAEQKQARTSKPTSAQVPTLAGVAGARPETKITLPSQDKPKAAAEVGKTASVPVLPAAPDIAKPLSAPALSASDKSMVVFDLSKTPTGPAQPVATKPAVVPEIPVAADQRQAAGQASKTEAAVATIPTLPALPEPASTVPPAIAPDKAKPAAVVSNAVGHASVSSEPVIPSMPLKAVAPPAPLPLAASPIAARAVTPSPESGAERPSFVVMENRGSESEQGIKLPGVPNAVVAFGQPATVTAPPPDLVRKKTLETHTVRVMISQLKDSLYPSQRERAAEGLTSANWKVHPQVVEALCRAALDDPAPAVRSRCAESLAAMNIRSEAALGVIHKLQADKDETVRAKADEALKVLEPTELPQ
jgi:hypothetical protein